MEFQINLGAVFLYSLLVLCQVPKQAVANEEEPEAQEEILDFSFVKVLDEAGLKQTLSTDTASFIYFMKEKNLDNGERERLPKSFLRQYDQAASYLNAYAFHLSVFNCDMKEIEDVSIQTMCTEADTEKIYAYRNNEVLIDLSLWSMYDVNSIMSNVLQVVLLDEVVVVQNLKSRKELEKKSAGQKDVIMSYHNAIGTLEHRVFMEIAYAYQDKYTFAVSTEASTFEGLQDEEQVDAQSTIGVWVLYCRQRFDEEQGCLSSNYRGLYGLLDMAAFFKNLAAPTMFDSMAAVSQNKLTANLPVIQIIHSDETKDQVLEVTDSLQFDVHGFAALVVEKKEIPKTKSDIDPRLIVSTHSDLGDTVMYYGGEWTIEGIQNYLLEKIFPVREESPAVKGASPDDYTEDDERIEDMVVAVAFEKRKTIGKAPTIPALTDKTFYPAVNERPLTFVLFYIPFDSVGLLFLEAYAEAKAMTLQQDQPADQHPLMRVNCFDWTDVCAKENITTYPTVNIYREGKKEKYMHALDKDVLARTVALLQMQNGPLILADMSDVENTVNGPHNEQVVGLLQNMVILNPSSEKDIAEFKEAAKALETQMLFAYVDLKLKADSIIPKGTLLHRRLRDEYQPTETLTGNMDAQTIIDFLRKGQFNLLPELDHLAFPALYAQKKPLGVLFYDSAHPDASAHLTHIVNAIKTKKAQDVLFCKMNMNNNKIAEAILSNYTQESELPTFAVVNHEKGHVHVVSGVEAVQEQPVLLWIKAVLDTTLPPSMVLKKGEWKPAGRHYDFLAMMDKEAKQKKEKRNTAHDEGDGDRAEELDEGENDTRDTLLALQESRLYAQRTKRKVEQPATPKSSTTVKGSENVHSEL